MENRLKFNENGKFRILMVSDIQERVPCDPRAPKCYRALVDRVKPDLIIWGGDNIDGRKAKTAEDLRAHLDVFAKINEDAGIPWMHVYGNHDYDMAISAREQSAIYAEYPHCISGVSPEGVPGVSNYLIEIYDPATGRPAYAIYALDSMYKDAEIRTGVPYKDMKMDGIPFEFRKWEPIRFEQQRWYYETSVTLEKEVGSPVRAMAVMHVPPHEIMNICNNPERCGATGFWDEKIECAAVNSGVFATMLERGDVECIASGHLHSDTVHGVYAGIHMCLDACAGFTPPAIDERRGGRVFDIGLDGSFATEYVAYSSFMDITAG